MIRVLLQMLLGFVLYTVIELPIGIHAQQIADPNFNSSVDHPAYRRTHPTVVIDEAHSNFHTAEGRYKPFADLLRSDGYQVLSGTKRFDKGILRGVRVLVISNAQAPDATDDFSGLAFTEQECDIVRDWVRAGGSLLLIADHTPYGNAAENLAQRFGVEMGKGFVLDLANSFDLPSSEPNPTFLMFSRSNGLLGHHPLLRGRNPSEQVQRVVAFTGQSLGVPRSATALLKLGPSAYESPSRSELEAALGIDSKGGPSQTSVTGHAKAVADRAQGIAMKFGKGRVIVFGEAAMFSAQLIWFKEGEQQREFKMGMSVLGSDDRQLALNVLHWLSGLLN